MPCNHINHRALGVCMYKCTSWSSLISQGASSCLWLHLELCEGLGLWDSVYGIGLFDIVWVSKASVAQAGRCRTRVPHLVFVKPSVRSHTVKELILLYARLRLFCVSRKFYFER